MDYLKTHRELNKQAKQYKKVNEIQTLNDLQTLPVYIQILEFTTKRHTRDEDYL